MREAIDRSRPEPAFGVWHGNGISKQGGQRPGFISKALDRWAYDNGYTLDFSRPGTDNAFVESFNGHFS